MTRDEIARMIRGRIEKARALAKGTTDARTRQALLEMAEEAQADLDRLLAEPD